MLLFLTSAHSLKMKEMFPKHLHYLKSFDVPLTVISSLVEATVGEKAHVAGKSFEIPTTRKASM